MTLDGDRAVLRSSRVSVLSSEADPQLDAMARTIAGSVRVAGLGALEALLARWTAACDATVAAKTLDLCGHATATGHLRLGDSVIDVDDPTVMDFVQRLASRRMLSQLGVVELRLLACHTASSPGARRTICGLADALGVEVYGTRQLLYDAHHDEQGFRDAWRFLLVSARELRAVPARPADPGPHALELAALPAMPLQRDGAWPLRIATAPIAQQILGLVRCADGAPWSGPPLVPTCEIAMPAAGGGHFVAPILLDGAFMRFHPRGRGSPGLIYPVREPHALLRIADALPLA